jgi:putative glutamine amidotransferase
VDVSSASRSSHPPVIGVTSYVEQTRWGVWDQRAVVLPYSYVAALERAGARVLVLPPDTEGVPAVLDRLDGLVLAGGADLDPALYGESPHPETLGLREDRDAAELPLLAESLARALPVLGICRGMQLMAVAHGGSLVQHLPDAVGHERHRPRPGVYGRHEVRLAAGSVVGTVLGDRIDVPSYHHQGLATAGSLTVSGWADDGTPEAVEDPGRPFAVGVLWHPEADTDPRLFDALVAAAR